MTAAKAAVAILTAAALTAQSAITDGTISGQEWLAILIAVLGAIAVYLTPNHPTATDGHGRHEMGD